MVQSTIRQQRENYNIHCKHCFIPFTQQPIGS